MSTTSVETQTARSSNWLRGPRLLRTIYFRPTLWPPKMDYCHHEHRRCELAGSRSADYAGLFANEWRTFRQSRVISRRGYSNGEQREPLLVYGC